MTGRRTRNSPFLVLTCEHAGNRVPREYAGLFTAGKRLLASHRGWDPGALQLARLMARRLRRPLLETPWSRLLVESNRSLTNPRLWSRFTKDLPREDRRRIVERYWRPHRHAVEAAIADGIARRGQVVHVAVHSFTPVMDGEVRDADVGFLYDSKRVGEREFARRWGALLRKRAPDLRVRYNYPYLGSADGLPTGLRRRHPGSRYIGYELEVNQALATSTAWKRVGEALATSLDEALRSKES